MDTIIDKIENSEALIKIRLKEGDYQPRVAQKIKDFSKKANIKGFRPGKVPTGVIKRMYGDSFLLEEVNSIVSEELNKILKERDIQFLGEPMPAEEQSSIDWENQKDFEFVFSIGYAEEFDLKIDKKMKVENHHIKVDKKVLDETIDNLRRQFGEITNPEEVGNGDTIYGQLRNGDGVIDKEVSIDLREVKDGVSKKWIGMKSEEEMTLDVKKSFSDSHYFKHASGLSDDEIKKSKGKFTFKIKGISHTVPCEINQELFDKTFGEGVVKDEAEFQAKVEETIRERYASEEVQFFNHRVKEEIIKKSGIKLPDGFLKKWLLATNKELTEDQLEVEYEHYEKEMKWSLIRNKIADRENLKVEHPEVVAEAKNLIAQQFGGMVAQLGDQMDSFAENYLKAENGDNYLKVFNQVQNSKVLDYIKNQITSKDKEISLDDFRKLT